MPTITQEEIARMLVDAEAEIRQSLVEEAKLQIKRSLEWSLNGEIKKIVEKYIAEEIGPEVRAALIDSKPVILQAVTEFAQEMGAMLTAGLIEDAKKNMGQSYNRHRLMETLFK